MLYDCQCQQLSTFVTKRQEVNITKGHYSVFNNEQTPQSKLLRPQNDVCKNDSTTRLD